MAFPAVQAGRALAAYNLVIFSGVFEPIFYLIGIGLGIGAIAGPLTLADGRQVAYVAYVVPVMWLCVRRVSGHIIPPTPLNAALLLLLVTGGGRE